MANESDNGRASRGGKNGPGKRPWQVPRLETVRGREAESSFTSGTGTDGFYYS